MKLEEEDRLSPAPGPDDPPTRGLAGLLAWAGVALTAVAFYMAAAAYSRIVQAHRFELWSLIDLEIYREGALAARMAPQSLYRDGFGPFHLPFIYPPFAAMVMSVVARVRFEKLKQWTTMLSIAAMSLAIWWSFGIAGLRRGALRLAATLALSAVVLWLEPVQQTLSFGQINLLVMALVLADLTLDDSRGGKGVLVGVATGLKLTPAVFIAYLWLTGRRRAAGIALGTFAATVVAGFLWVPAAARAYWSGAFLVGDKVGRDFLGNQSLNGIVFRALPTSPLRPLVWVVGAAVIGIGGLYLATTAHRRGQELLGIVAASGTALVISPLSWTHHYVWVAPLLVLLAVTAWQRRSWLLALAGAAITGLGIAWNAQVDNAGAFDPRLPSVPRGLIWRLPHADSREASWHGLQLLTGNAYVLVAMALIVAAVWHLAHEQVAGDVMAPGSRSVPRSRYAPRQ